MSGGDDVVVNPESVEQAAQAVEDGRGEFVDAILSAVGAGPAQQPREDDLQHVFGFGRIAPGYRADDFQVLTDGPIQKVEDLKGKVIGTNAAGSGVDVASRAMLRKHGLEANRDYTIVEAPFPGMRAMLAEKKVDIIPTVLPFALDPELKKIAHPLFSITDAIGVSQFAMWAMRKPFIDKNRAAIVDFMEDTMRIERWYLDPKNHDEVAQIASRITKQPPERFGWLFTKNDYYRNPDMRPDLDALQKNVDMTKDLGFVKASFDVKAHSDLSLIEEAAKRLK